MVASVAQETFGRPRPYTLTRRGGDVGVTVIIIKLGIHDIIRYTRPIVLRD